MDMEIETATESRPDQAFQRVLLAQMVVAEVMGVALIALCRNTRGDARAAFARQTAMYLCHAVFAMRVGAVAKAFRRDRSTVRHAVRLIEQNREADPEFDRSFAWLELSLCRAGALDV